MVEWAGLIALGIALPLGLCASVMMAVFCLAGGANASPELQRRLKRALRSIAAGQAVVLAAAAVLALAGFVWLAAGVAAIPMVVLLGGMLWFTGG